MALERTFEKGAFEMGEYLPGSLQDRLVELREANGYNSQYKLAEKIGVDRSTYSRIENGDTKTISSDILIKLSKLFHVPTDYILGLSDTPENTGYDIKELGLSVEAAKNLYSKKVDPRVINELLINDKFATAVRMIAMYFTNSVAKLIQSQNALLENSVGLLDGLVKDGKVPKDRDIAETRRMLRAAKLPQDSYEIDRIQKQLTASVRDIKKKLVSEVSAEYENPKKLEYEVMEKVKEEAFAAPSLKDLTDDEKVSVIKNTIMQGILVYSDLSEDKMALIDPLVEQIALLLIELWKES